MRINTNMMAMNALRYSNSAESKQAKSMQKLSSGLAINSAADDAAGLAISEKMRAQINGLDQASENAQDGISMIQTAEGALEETTSMLHRMRELTIQANNGTNTADETGSIKAEMDQLISEIDSISDNTEFNGQKLLNDAAVGTITLQVGANISQSLSITMVDMGAGQIGTDAGLMVSGLDVTDFTTNSFDVQLQAIDDAISDVTTQRSAFGAAQNRLEHTINNLGTTSENLTAAESRIRDVDMAKEMMEFTKAGILQQASQAMMAQANQLPQGVLQLLR